MAIRGVYTTKTHVAFTATLVLFVYMYYARGRWKSGRPRQILREISLYFTSISPFVDSTHRKSFPLTHLPISILACPNLLTVGFAKIWFFLRESGDRVLIMATYCVGGTIKKENLAVSYSRLKDFWLAFSKSGFRYYNFHDLLIQCQY